MTLVSSYYSITLPAGEKVSRPSSVVILLDILTSFIVIPFFVVWFWRGSWLVMDFYLWEFSPENSDVWKSIGYSTIIALLLMGVTSETAFSFVRIDNQVLLGVVGRLRTYVLAWGVVNYWRAVWLIWDEAAGTSVWSCWVCHLIPLALLSAMGCLSCILAPASTLGVDFVPHPECADEPLFSNLPVPADDLYLFAIARHPQVLDEQDLPKEAIETKKSFIRMSLITNEIDVDDLMASKIAEKSIEMGVLPPLKAIDEDDTRHTTKLSNAEGDSTPPQCSVEGEDDDDVMNESLARFAAEMGELPPNVEEGATPIDDNDPDEEAEMAAAWAEMEKKMEGDLAPAVAEASTAWASGGTGRRGSYSSVRSKAEVAEHRSSYFDLQRPDLDRRVSRRESTRASMRGSAVRGSLRGSTSGGGAVRRTSDLFRNR